MIPPIDRYVIVLRRVPWNIPILVSELCELVEADLDLYRAAWKRQEIRAQGMEPWIGARQAVKELVEKGYLIAGQTYKRWDGDPPYVSLADTTKRDWTLQPGIKQRADELPMSRKGLLMTLAREAAE
jgi:hypothetical protein